MAQLFGLSAQVAPASAPCSPRNVVGSGIIPVIQKGLRWVDAPAAYSSHKTFYNRCRRW